MIKALVRLDELIAISVGPSKIDIICSDDQSLKSVHSAPAECNNIIQYYLRNPVESTGNASFGLSSQNGQTQWHACAGWHKAMINMRNNSKSRGSGGINGATIHKLT